jgi:hypothetical protein
MPPRVTLDAGATRQGVLEVLVPKASAEPGVVHFTVIVTTQPGHVVEEFPQTFIAPTADGKTP